MMKPLLLLSCLLSALVSPGQFEKKVLKSIEKNAVFLPLDTLIISQNAIGVGSNSDSVFGKTVVTALPGWSRYYVNIEGATSPEEITDGTGFKHEMPPFIQNKVGGIYISRTELSNKEYSDFVTWTRVNRPDEVVSVLLDSQGWIWDGYMYNVPMMNYYHFHPAYGNYPLVNVSHQQALYYLKWLTDQYNSSPKRKYNRVNFRLPTEAEWMYAYLGGENEYVATYRGYFRKENGQLTANFVLYPPVTQIRLQDSAWLQSSDTTLNLKWETHHHETSTTDTLSYTLTHRPRIMTLGYLNESYRDGMYTAPVKSYWPNGFGIYNMAGNVAEFVAEEGIAKGGHWNTTGYYLRPTSRETFLDQPSSSRTRGFRWVMEVIEE